MIKLLDIRYVRLGTKDLAGAKCYAEHILGLRQSSSAGNSKHGQQLYFRSDERDHTLVYFDGDPLDHTVGFELKSHAELDSALGELTILGIDAVAGTEAECDLRRVSAMVRFVDPSGNRIELVVGPHHCGQRFFPTRDTGSTGFSHVGLRSRALKRDEEFWTKILGAKVSDRIGDAALLRIDEVHHKIALFPSAYPGVQHINHQVNSIDDIMRSWYFLNREGVKVVFGPGRHPTSGAMFLYFEGPDGMVYEFSSGVCSIPELEDHLPRQFPFAPESFCMWGAKPNIPEFN